MIAWIVLIVTVLARRLPQPPLPTPAYLATVRAHALAGRLRTRHANPYDAPGLSAEGRRRAILYAAVLDEEDIDRLADLIIAEHADGPDAPPISHEVTL